MARRKQPPAAPPTTDVREYLAEKYRALGERFRGLGAVGPSGGEVPPDWSPCSDVADRLEAGEPVEVHAWELPRWAPEHSTRGCVVVEADGRIKPIPDGQRQAVEGL